LVVLALFLQELLETKTKELQNKDQELQQKQLQVEAVLKRLDDCSQEILAMREKQRCVLHVVL
jgi:hypothetical protein